MTKTRGPVSHGLDALLRRGLVRAPTTTWDPKSWRELPALSQPLPFTSQELIDLDRGE